LKKENAVDSDYRRYRDIFQGRPLPFAYVDLDRFDANVSSVVKRAEGTPIRLASKSIRCVDLMHRIFEASDIFQGIMAYSAREAVFLTGQGFDDILVAYPVWGEVRAAGVTDAIRAGKRIVLMVDAEEHIDFLEEIGAEAGVTVEVCLDVDMSSDFPGIHFGVRRSGVTRPDQALKVYEATKRCAHVSMTGVMGYEAQIAGLPDQIPGQVLKNAVVQFLKKRSIRELSARRAAVVNALKDAGCDLRFVNGGGTGSVETTIQEDVVTECTVGSGFYTPTLFDHYSNFKSMPAAGFALEITRQPMDTVFTCHGGGYIASGPPGWDRVPAPWLPHGAKLLSLEGAGEVQTPIEYTGPETLRLGDPVFLRHAKAGELCERFTTLLLVSGEAIVGEVPTYRGQGQCYV
jgi:D-serine deaminase-like pyridoxal phosphate-dependent protein